MITFTPMSEEQLQMANLLPEGTYQFEVTNAKDSRSISGNQHIEIVLKIMETSDRSRTVYDYLTGHESFLFKVRHFCKATNQLKTYEQGKLSVQDCIGKTGFVKIGIKAASVSKDGKQWPPKNFVKDYVESGAVESKQALPFNDEVPF